MGPLSQVGGVSTSSGDLRLIRGHSQGHVGGGA